MSTKPPGASRVREGRHAPVLDLLLEDPARAPVDRGRARLSDTDVDARDLGVVHPRELDEVPGIVHHHDHHTEPPGPGLGLRRSDDLACGREAQHFFVESERLLGPREDGRREGRPAIATKCFMSIWMLWWNR
jgi:hypothetical protein